VTPAEIKRAIVNDIAPTAVHGLADNQEAPPAVAETGRFSNTRDAPLPTWIMERAGKAHLRRLQIKRRAHM